LRRRRSPGKTKTLLSQNDRASAGVVIFRGEFLLATKVWETLQRSESSLGSCDDCRLSVKRPPALRLI